MKVAVIGECLLDMTVADATHRTNPECAKVPIYAAKGMAANLGGAGNVASILKQRGHEVTLFTPLSGWAKTFIISICEREEIVLHQLSTPHTWHTPVKYRVYADRQYRVRFDLENCPRTVLHHALMEAAQALPEGLDAVIFSDYGKGLYDCDEGASCVSMARAKATISVADFKPQHAYLFREVDAVTPNQREAHVCGLPEAAMIHRALRTRMAFVTCDVNGAAWSGESGSGISPLVESGGDEYCGAGDAFTAAVVECLCEGECDAQAVAEYANSVACAYTRQGRPPQMSSG